jgi:hypothetical protein
MIFGKDCVVSLELLELKKDPSLSQDVLDAYDSEIAAIKDSMANVSGPLALKTKKISAFREKLGELNALRLDIQRKISLIAEHEASLLKYSGMSEEQFLAHFLSEYFD